jgi:hypothetical protein
MYVAISPITSKKRRQALDRLRGPIPLSPLGQDYLVKTRQMVNKKFDFHREFIILFDSVNKGG